MRIIHLKLGLEEWQLNCERVERTYREAKHPAQIGRRSELAARITMMCHGL